VRGLLGLGTQRLTESSPLSIICQMPRSGIRSKPSCLRFSRFQAKSFAQVVSPESRRSISDSEIMNEALMLYEIQHLLFQRALLPVPVFEHVKRKQKNVALLPDFQR